ncbi:MAG: VOC family protein, partial [Phycisphaerae bacterium]|nr:VOC family protein [Gemmatimonadaceae bacterium]
MSITTMMNRTTPLSWADTQHAVLPAGLRLGPVRLAVTDLDRSVAFYEHALGAEAAARITEHGHAVSRLGVSGADPVLVLQEEPWAVHAERHAGLYHVAYNFASRLELARALRR